MNPSPQFQVLEELDRLISAMNVLRVQITQLDGPTSPLSNPSKPVKTLAGCLSHYARSLTGPESPRDLAWTEAMYEKHPRY